MTEVWILGAAGRVGRAVARRLAADGIELVLTGRDRERLAAAAAELQQTPRLVTGSLAETLAALGRAAPAAVLNTIGPFPETAPQVLAACSPTTHYVDVANEPAAVSAVLDRAAALDPSRAVVTGAGFGVLGTESVVATVCADRRPPATVRVDAIASVAGEPGRLGTALARSIVDGVVQGGHQVQTGRLVRARPGDRPITLVTPDGDRVRSAGLPSGELYAAWAASDAASVLAASNMAPSAPLIRGLLPLATALLRIGPVGRFVVARLAAVRTKQTPAPRAHSWAHARAEWADGEVREGWLRAPEGMEFTSAVAAETVRRCVRGEAEPGGWTPAAAFGPELAVAAGGEFVLEQPAGSRSPK